VHYFYEYVELSPEDTFAQNVLDLLACSAASIAIEQEESAENVPPVSAWVDCLSFKFSDAQFIETKQRIIESMGSKLDSFSSLGWIDFMFRRMSAYLFGLDGKGNRAEASTTNSEPANADAVSPFETETEKPINSAANQTACTSDKCHVESLDDSGPGPSKRELNSALLKVKSLATGITLDAVLRGGLRDASYKTAMGAIVLAIHLYDFLECVLITQDSFGRILFRIDEQSLSLSSDSFPYAEPHDRVAESINLDTSDLKCSSTSPLVGVRAFSDAPTMSPTSPFSCSPSSGEGSTQHISLSANHTPKRRPNIWTNPETKRLLLMSLLISAKISFITATEFCQTFLSSGACSEDLRPLAQRVLGGARLILNAVECQSTTHTAPDSASCQSPTGADTASRSSQDSSVKAEGCDTAKLRVKIENHNSDENCVDSRRKRLRGCCSSVMGATDMLKRLAAGTTIDH